MTRWIGAGLPLSNARNVIEGYLNELGVAYEADADRNLHATMVKSLEFANRWYVATMGTTYRGVIACVIAAFGGMCR